MSGNGALAIELYGYVLAILGQEAIVRTWMWAMDREGACPDWLRDLAVRLFGHCDNSGFVVRSDDDEEQTTTQEIETTCFRPSNPDPARRCGSGAATTESRRPASRSRSMRSL